MGKFLSFPESDVCCDPPRRQIALLAARNWDVIRECLTAARQPAHYIIEVRWRCCMSSASPACCCAVQECSYAVASACCATSSHQFAHARSQGLRVLAPPMLRDPRAMCESASASMQAATVLRRPVSAPAAAPAARVVDCLLSLRSVIRAYEPRPMHGCLAFKS